MSKQLTPRENQIRTVLIERQRQVQSILGDKKKSDKFLATSLKIANDYALRECHPNSIIETCVSVAELDLSLSKIMSQVYLVPFKAKREAKVASVQLIITARGYNALLAREGWGLKSYIVYEDDEFTHEIDGFDEKFYYKRDLESSTLVPKFAVAIAKSPNGDIYGEIMNEAQIEKNRKVSSNQSGQASGVWAEWKDRMWEKTVVKRLAKKLPLGEKIAEAISRDDLAIDTEVINSTSATNSTNDLNNLPPHNNETGEVYEPQQDQKIIEIEVD